MRYAWYFAVYRFFFFHSCKCIFERLLSLLWALLNKHRNSLNYYNTWACKKKKKKEGEENDTIQSEGPIGYLLSSPAEDLSSLGSVQALESRATIESAWGENSALALRPSLLILKGSVPLSDVIWGAEWSMGLIRNPSLNHHEVPMKSLGKSSWGNLDWGRIWFYRVSTCFPQVFFPQFSQKHLSLFNSSLGWKKQCRASSCPRRTRNKTGLVFPL